MQFKNENIEMWYGTSDAPAPDEIVAPGMEVAITIGVAPADASNQVEVRHRINQGRVETVGGRWLRNDAGRLAQYFRVYLHALRPGDQVESTPVCRCAGRQVPSLEEAEQFVSSFRVEEEQMAETVERAMPREAESVSSLPASGSRRSASGRPRPLPPPPASTPSAEGNGRASSPPQRRAAPRSASLPPTRRERPLQRPLPEEEEEPRAVAEEQTRSHRFHGRLLAEETGNPLRGFTVHSEDLDTGAEPGPLGFDFSDGEGRFELVFDVLLDPATGAPQSSAGNRRLRLHVHNRSGEEIYQTEVRTPADEAEVVDIRIPGAAKGRAPVRWKELAPRLQRTSPQLLDKLAAR